MSLSVTDALSKIATLPGTTVYVRGVTDEHGQTEWHILVRHLPIPGLNEEIRQIPGCGNTIEEAMDDFWRNKDTPTIVEVTHGSA